MAADHGVLVSVESKMIFLDFTFFRCYVDLSLYLATLEASH
jgi:hypothetical protein